MADALYWIGVSLAVAGALLTVAGSVGVMRFPDVYARLHAASITDTGGATLMLLGLGLLAGFTPVAVKLLVVWAFIMITSPTASHALANAAFGSGLRPWIGPFRILKDNKEGARND
jgi:multicomponent Na+:H+ antiporter subunit G